MAFSNRTSPRGVLGLIVAVLCALVAIPAVAQAQACVAPSTYSAYTGTDAKPIPTAPVFGSANSLVVDPTFGSNILRVTDQNTLSGASFIPTDAGFHRTWNADSTAIQVAGAHGDGYWLEFNPVTFKVGDGSSHPVLHPLPINAAWEWSNVNPDIIYFLNGTQLATYNKSTSVVTNLGGPSNGDPVTNWAVVVGLDKWVCSAAGVGSQNTYTELFCINPAVPSTRKLIDVVNKRINGVLQTDPNWPTSAPGQTIGIHSISGGTGASWLGVTFHQQSWGGNGDAVLNLTTNTWSRVTNADIYFSGHFSVGNGRFENGSGSVNGNDSRGAVTRDANNLMNASQYVFIGQPPATVNWFDAEHSSWFNSLCNTNAPVLQSRYTLINPTPWLPWIGEITASATDGSNVVWRFAHNHNLIGEYYGEAFAQISNDGNWALFSSPWDGTLGASPGRDFGLSTRIDTFIVQLRSGTTGVTANTVTPAAGTGASQVFTLQYGDATGAINLSTAAVRFKVSTATTDANSCLAYYSRTTGQFSLVTDAGTSVTSGSPGGSGMLQNSACSLALGTSTVTTSGTMLTLQMALTLTPAFAGVKVIDLYAANLAGTTTGWQTRGAWTVPGPPAPAVTAGPVTPAAGTGASQVFTLQYGDTTGATNLITAAVRFNVSTATTDANACLAYYSRTTGQFSLVTDAGTSVTSGSPGGSGSLQNSACSLALSTSTATTSGTTLTLQMALTFTPAFAGAKVIAMYAASATGAATGWQTRGAWTVPGPPAPAVTAGPVTPAAGTGASQVFTLQYGDTTGAANLSTAAARFKVTTATTDANSCLAYYSRDTGQLSLVTDAGTSVTSGSPGGGGTLQNSACTLALGTSSVTISGTTLTMQLALTFAPAFAGAKGIDMYAANIAGATTWWQTRGTWTVPGAAASAVTVVSVTPAAGTGASQVFTLQYGDTAGGTDLSLAAVWFGATTASQANACLAYFSRDTGQFSLVTDAGTSVTSGSPGGSGMLQNSSCSLALGTSTVTTGGTTLTMQLALTFTPAFAGAKTVNMYASNVAGATTGWQPRGAWTVPGAVAPTVTAGSVTPAAGTGASQTFSLQYGDAAGAADLGLAAVRFQVSTATTDANSCLAYYSRDTGQFSLVTDAGTSVTSGSPGGSGTLQNGACALALGTSTVTASGTTLTLQLALTFKPAFAGAKVIEMYAANLAGTTTGWQPRGAWTVPGAATSVVTATSVTPNAGSGASQLFTLQYGDTGGATNLTTAAVRFKVTTATTDANSCLAYYSRDTGQLSLVTDAGTSATSGMPGGGGMLQNSACSVALGTSSVATSGTTLTLRVALTFASAFAGAKGVDMYAGNAAGTTTGWQPRGAWTVP